MVEPLKVMPVGLLYGSIVKVFARQMYPISALNKLNTEQQKLNFLRKRRVSVGIFMATYAPLISSTLLNCVHRYLLSGFSLE